MRPADRAAVPLCFAICAACAVCVAAAAGTGCAAGGGGGDSRGGGAGSKGMLDVDNVPPRPGGGSRSPLADLPAPPGCGNGVRTPNEACDDANMEDGDGCSANCLSVEPGFACQPAGVPCRVIARCGDRVLAPSEGCDDGNANDGDGCSARCKLEEGYACDEPGERCRTTTCGDGEREGAEGCDDGTVLPFDGCSARCQAEPMCEAGQGCSSPCGDGLVIEEACDDGNARDGDGCSSRCEVEPGFTCERARPCEMLNGQCVLRVPVLYRDFEESHPDFQIGCGQLVTGVVAAELDRDGKPVLVDGGAVCIESAETFAGWYRDHAMNATIAGELLLHDDGRAGFVNRFGPNGEQWQGQESYQNLTWGGAVGSGCAMCTPTATGQCFDPCTPWNDMNQACCGELTQSLFDGNPLFFPLDDAADALTDMRHRAKIPEQYGYPGWPYEDSVFPDAGTHDFHFTTEVVYWFEHDAARAAVLDFSGDDDVWVFVNGKLAVDLGGPHVPENGSVTLDAASSQRFELTDGEVYEIRVFHAERKTEGSSFKLTLSGFDAQPSDCVPRCGDGIVTAGEECDDGVNDGGYEECAAGCVLDQGCGDGTLQDGEDCDDGNRQDGDACGSACRELTVD